MNQYQKECAAKRLCELRGIDPYQSTPHGAKPDAHGFVPAICLYSPAWMLLLDEIESQEQIDEAIKFGEEIK